MTWLRSALFAAALVLVTPPYALLALATFPLPRMLRYRITDSNGSHEEWADDPTAADAEVTGTSARPIPLRRKLLRLFSPRHVGG